LKGIRNEPKSAWQRPALAWLQRARCHLEQHRSESLAANDAAAYRADVTSIKMLDVFAYLLQRDERQRRCKKREELARLRIPDDVDQRSGLMQNTLRVHNSE
jgi:hypothetical protein